MTQYSEHFTRNEFADPQTGVILLAPGFIENLEALRVAYDDGMWVKDGCRSDQYNKWLLERGYPASKNSFHLIENEKWRTGGCCAVDIKRPGLVALARFVGLALERRWSIGIGRTFVHLDRRVDYTDLPVSLRTY